ncbi:cytochrome c family protein [Paracoccaceae bacterium]|jgi:cytochrome c2|nr:cytochrome c family protein [Paracoccaceae bacterium]
MELNKLVAGICATLLVFLGLNFFAELIYDPHHGDDHALAFALEIEDSGDAGAEEEIDFGALLASADLAKGEKIFKKCKACHAVEEGMHKTGPSLWGVVGQGVAAAAGFTSYSGKLPASETWSADNLSAFLEAPKKWAPGTSMGFAGLKKPEDRAAIIAYLNEADGTPIAFE